MSRRFQFSLRALLAVTGLLCFAFVAVPWWAVKAREWEIEHLHGELVRREEHLEKLRRDLQANVTPNSAVEALLETKHISEIRHRLLELEEQ